MEAREEGKFYYLKANWGLGRAPRGSVSVPTFFPIIMVHSCQALKTSQVLPCILTLKAVFFGGSRVRLSGFKSQFCHL